jgi:hypothetical protein
MTVVFFPAAPVPVDYPFWARVRFIEELFLVDAKNVVQLTNFRRSDTARAGRGGAVVGRRVFFERLRTPSGPTPASTVRSSRSTLAAVACVSSRACAMKTIARRPLAASARSPAPVPSTATSRTGGRVPSRSRRAAIPSAETHTATRSSACAPTARGCVSSPWHAAWRSIRTARCTSSCPARCRSSSRATGPPWLPPQDDDCPDRWCRGRSQRS